MPVYKTKNEKTKDNKIWYFMVSYTDLLGNKKRYKSKKYLTKEEATKAEAKYRINKDQIAEVKSINIYDLYNSYFFLDKNIVNKESSLFTKEYRIRKYILPFFEKNKEYTKVMSINPENLKKWKEWINQKELALQTKKAIYNTFSSLLTYAVEKYNLQYNPLKLVGNFQERNDKIQDKEKIRFLTEKEYKIFIEYVDEEYKVIFHFLYEVGCRKGEMQALKWNDIDFEKNKVRINKTLSTKNISGEIKITNTKNKKIRYIDISTKLSEELKNHYLKTQNLDGFNDDWYVFGGIRYLSATTLARKKDEAFKKIKDANIAINEITIHEFRHSSASYMISNNISIEIIAYRLGDSAETVRRVYAHLFPNTQKEAKGLFENL